MATEVCFYCNAKVNTHRVVVQATLRNCNQTEMAPKEVRVHLHCLSSLKRTGRPHNPVYAVQEAIVVKDGYPV